jgi:hypothetical protein
MQIKLTWRGKAFEIPREKTMRARLIIESAYPLQKLAEHMRTGTPHLAQLSVAYGELLRFAGAKVEDDDVYDGMFAGKESLASVAAECLFNIMIPESVRAGGEEPREANPTQRSKSYSKRRSARVG